MKPCYQTSIQNIETNMSNKAKQLLGSLFHGELVDIIIKLDAILQSSNGLYDETSLEKIVKNTMVKVKQRYPYKDDYPEWHKRKKSEV